MSLRRSDLPYSAEFREAMDGLVRVWATRFISSRLLLIGILTFMFAPIPAAMFQWGATEIAAMELVTVVGLLMIGASAVVSFIGRVRIKQAKQAFVGINLEYCMVCRASLPEGPGEGTCAQCKSPYHRGENRGRWKERIRRMTRERPAEWRRWSWMVDSIIVLVTIGLLGLVILFV